MRMNAARMKKVADYARKNGVEKAAKDMLTFEGNGMVDYSFKENFQTCVNAVRHAVRWVNSDKKRSKK